MADRGGIQLLSDTRRHIDINVPGENRLLYWGIGCLIVVGTIFAGLTVYAQRLEGDITDLDGRLASQNQERQQFESASANMAAFSKQSSLAGNLISGHLFWSKAFSKLQSISQPQLQMSSFSASAAKKEMVIAARAPNYTTIARQIAAFVSDDSIKDITLTNAKASNLGGLEFGIKIEFDEAKLLKSAPVRKSGTNQ